jgi:magnesium-transporting ATPase (P-type)
MHKFNGAITFDLVSDETDQKKSLSLKNIALRGMSLRNTEWIVGLVVYSGADTKIQKNLQDSTYKISNLLHKTNKAIIWIFVA